MGEREAILEIGVEGGGATVFRTALESGGWRFHVEGSSMYLDENDEGWRSWSSEPAHSVQEAIRSIADDGSWVLFHPISVHAVYRKTVWELVNDAASRLPDERQGMWSKRSGNWQRLCLEQS